VVRHRAVPEQIGPAISDDRPRAFLHVRSTRDPLLGRTEDTEDSRVAMLFFPQNAAEAFMTAVQVGDRSPRRRQDAQLMRTSRGIDSS
jgi:hypothetical protein